MRKPDHKCNFGALGRLPSLLPIAWERGDRCRAWRMREVSLCRLWGDVFSPDLLRRWRCGCKVAWSGIFPCCSAEHKCLKIASFSSMYLTCDIAEESRFDKIERKAMSWSSRGCAELLWCSEPEGPKHQPVICGWKMSFKMKLLSLTLMIWTCSVLRWQAKPTCCYPGWPHFISAWQQWCVFAIGMLCAKCNWNFQDLVKSKEKMVAWESLGNTVIYREERTWTAVYTFQMEFICGQPREMWTALI